MEYSEKAEEILTAAEVMARRGGYNGFSFREIAKAVGVKSASVHYHFPTKEDLGAALARRYTRRFLDALGDPEQFNTAKAAAVRYADAYRTALVADGLMCLCGVLGAEFDALPENVGAEARRFFEMNIDWLIAALANPGGPRTRSERRKRAVRMIATLEGAMLLSRTLGDHSIFEDAVKSLAES